LFFNHHETVKNQWPDLQEKRMIHEIVRRMINSLTSDLITTSQDLINSKKPADIDDVRHAGEPLVILGKEMKDKNIELKRFLRKNLYRHKRVQNMMSEAKNIIRALFESFMQNKELLPEELQKEIGEAPGDDYRARKVADYIAGMTDRYAIAEYVRITNNQTSMDKTNSLP